MDGIRELCNVVRQTAYSIHVHFRHGFPEKVYENALTHRLRKLGVAIEQQQPISVYDVDGTSVGHFFADLVVERRLILEVKSVRHLASEHEAQLLGYLRATGVDHGMLINFGASRFQVRKFISDEANVARSGSLDPSQ